MKQVFKLVKFFLVILLVSFTSCSNDLSEKNKEISFSFELPQEKINRATNENSDNTLWNINAQIENTKDIIQKIEKTAYSGETVTLTFKEIIVGQEVKINIDLTKKDEKTPTYTGSSDWFIVKNGNNKINITLNKIVEDKIPDEEKPDDNEDTNDEPDDENNDSPVIIIVDATLPEIITQPQSIVEIATPNSTNNSITKKLSLSAKSTDKGNLSFIWQEKNPDDIWQNFEPITTTTYSDRIESSIDVTVEKDNSKTFKCIITNTNNLVNGNKTATIETNEVTVAYIEGQLASIEAQYIGEYEKFNYEDFYTDGKVTVTETYKSGDTQTEVDVTADKSRYTISPTKDYEKAIGYVPYTVKYISDDNISTEIKVPVKYELNANDFIIKSDTNNDANIGYSKDSPEKIPEHTYKTIVTLTAKDSLPQFIYETEELEQASEYNIIGNGISYHWVYRSVNDTNNVNNANTLTPNSTWCIGEEITLYYYVQFCPWVISLTGTSIVDFNNLTENTEYTLTATNEADTTSAVTWSSNNTSFTINNNTLTTPEASTESDLTATITAKVGDKEIGKLNVTVPGIPLGAQGNPFTLWSDLKSYLEVTTSEVSTIYVSGDFEATSGITVNRPVTIYPVDEVMITNNVDSYLFYVNKNFTLEGTQVKNIILDGNEKSYPLIYLSSNTPTISLKNCTLQETNGYAMNVNNPNSTINIENCTFKNNTTDIYLVKCGDILIKNSTFDYVEDKNNIEVINAPSLTLDGTLCIPRINFGNNTLNSYNLGIKIGDNLTLQNSDLPITISAINYIGTTYDCNFFELTNGQTLSDGVFALGNEDYILLNNGTITQLGLNASYPFTTWTQLKTYLEINSSDETEIYVKGNFTDVTSGITVNRPVTIHPVNRSVTISLNSSFNGNLFKVSKDFTLKGTDFNQFIIDGNNVQNSDSLITTSYSGSSIDITLEYVTIKNYTNNYSSTAVAGGAITFNSKNDTLSLKNCTFENVITNYTTNDYQLMIGAICFRDGNLILDSCTFTQNLNNYVDLYCYPQNNSTITLKGTINLPIIEYNNLHSLTPSNVDLQISLDDTFNSESNIQVYVDNISDEYDTDLFTLNGQPLPTCFTLLNEGYEFNSEGKIVEATSSGSGGGTSLSGTLVTTASDLKTQIENGTDSVIIIANNITITECIDISNPVQIAANSDVTLTSNIQSNNMFTLSSNLTLGGGAGTLTIKAPVAKHAIIATNSEKTITIKDGVKFTNCSYYCISLTGNDTLTIEGGEFSENTMTPIAIANNSSAVINISGGKIENNSATNMGAGIIVNNGTLNITGGTIQNNVLNGSNNGASIYISNGTGTATINENLYMSTITQNIIDGNLQ